MDTFWKDVRYALRALAQHPGFTAVALLILALGIGANTSIFGLVHSVLIEALPYPESGRLVMVHDVQSRLDGAPASYPEFLDWQEHGRTFEALAAFVPTRVTLTGEGAPEVLAAVRASAELSAMLGLRPALGRLTTADDDPGGGERVAVISHDLWQRRYGGDPDVLGSTLMLDGQSFAVVGVLAAGLEGRLPEDLFAGQERDLWLPLRLDEENAPRGTHFLTVVGRLRPGLTSAQADQEVAALAERLREDGRTRHGIRTIDLRERLVGDSRTPLLTLFGAVGFVLLIGCANVANLLLARASGRRREIAVRMALGASRGRLVRQLATESLLLAVAGGVLGVAAAGWSLRVIGAAGIEGLPRADELTVDGTVLVFALGLTLATALLFGLAPALRTTAVSLTESFHEAGRQTGAGPGRQRTRHLLVVAEVALALMLLVGAMLLIRSFRALLDQELGFEPDGVVAFSVALPTARYSEPRQQLAFFDQVLERIEALPGVEGAAVVNSLPVLGGPNGSFTVEGVTWPEDDRPLAEKRRVSPDYFRLLGIPLVKGRFFTDDDRAERPQVVIVNEEFARLYFPDRDPIGRRVDFQWNSEGMQEIVGVVGDVRHRGLEVSFRPAMYVPFAQNPQTRVALVVGSGVAPASLAESVRREVLAVDPDQPVARFRPMDEIVAASLRQRRLATGLLNAFAGVALLLTVLGIYGVMSYFTAQRTRELGVRMALGAGRWNLLHLVFRRGMTLAAVGVAIGLAGAFGLTRYLAALLFGVSPTDPGTFAAVVAVLFAVALAACYLPACRAARVDPAVALRHE